MDNEEVEYFAYFEPNMIAATRIIRMTFTRFGVVYEFADQDVDNFQPMSEADWASVDKERIVPVNDTILDIWKMKYPLGLEKVSKYSL